MQARKCFGLYSFITVFGIFGGMTPAGEYGRFYEKLPRGVTGGAVNFPPTCSTSLELKSVVKEKY
jgi:hypothetical protein